MSDIVSSTTRPSTTGTIYRTTEAWFNREYDRALAHHWEQLQKRTGYARDEVSEEFRATEEQLFWENYGGPWQYNQIIGWICLHVLGSQVRGDLWMMTGRRLNRKSRNQFKWAGKVLEIDCFPDESSEEIHAKLERELNRLDSEYRRKSRFFDLQCFRILAPCVDWQSLIRNAGQWAITPRR